MSTSGNGAQARWEVHLSVAVAQSLHALQQEASQQGRGQDVIDAYRHVIERLRLNPTTVGEPLYRLPAMRMQVRTVVVRPLAVDFAVCEDRPLVFLKGFRLLSP